MSEEKYNLSFIGGGLLLSESLVIAEQYLILNDWAKVESKAMDENLLQSRTISTSKRFFNEIRNRLLELSESDLNFLMKGSDVECRQLLWVAICRRYKFVRDFAVEVLNSHYRSYKAEIDVSDYSAFFNEKAQMHPELDRLAPSTNYKVRQILFKILRDAYLLDKKNKIIPSVFSEGLMGNLKDSDLLVFPVRN